MCRLQTEADGSGLLPHHRRTLYMVALDRSRYRHPIHSQRADLSDRRAAADHSGSHIDRMGGTL